MAAQKDRQTKNISDIEIGVIRKNWHNRIRIALIYPNSYYVGMSSLGFQTLYQLFNNYDHVACERAFLPDGGTPAAGRLRTIESDRLVADADIIAFSISFENDYPNLLTILASAGIPLRSHERTDRHPLVIAGGVTSSLNPEPIAAFIDCFLVGEAEAILPEFLRVFKPGNDKTETLKAIARSVPGAYVPQFYTTEYHPDGTISSFQAIEKIPVTVKRAYLKDLSQTSTCSSIVTPETSFASSFLIEVGRGCPHGCRFCSAGFIYRPPRFRPLSLLANNMQQGACLTDSIGLVGAAVSDLPGIEGLCSQIHGNNIRISFSSLRADRLSPQLLAVLKKSKVKTATIAPEVGSERLRTVINKGITEEHILNATTILVENGIPNLKLYFMVGLPTETAADIDAIGTLCKKVKHRFLQSSRARKKIGTITVSINSFVPKPFTPFQWLAMEDVTALKKKIKKIKTDLRRVANVKVNSDMPRRAYIQALLSRGDRRVADLLLLAHKNSGNWPKTLKTTPLDPDFFVHRERAADERLPWGFIDHGIKKSYLHAEFQRALKARPGPECRVGTCTLCGVCEPRAQTA